MRSVVKVAFCHSERGRRPSDAGVGKGLAEYMAKMAALLGEKPQVHFVGVKEGSAVLLQEVEQEAQPAVRERIQAMREEGGPQDARQAYKALNELLIDDRASGYDRA